MVLVENWTLPTSRGTNDKYVLQIDGTTGASDWAESLTAPEISAHNFDVSGSTDDGGINAYDIHTNTQELPTQPQQFLH